jgi:hypothetical protein
MRERFEDPQAAADRAVGSRLDRKLAVDGCGVAAPRGGATPKRDCGVHDDVLVVGSRFDADGVAVRRPVHGRLDRGVVVRHDGVTALRRGRAAGGGDASESDDRRSCATFQDGSTRDGRRRVVCSVHGGPDPLLHHRY